MPEKKHPEPTVGAVIVNPKGKIFLMRSHKWSDLFVIPGGHIELGETMEEALKREIKEETNLDISDIHFLNVQDSVFLKTFHKKKHFIFLNYSCRTDSTDVKLNDEGQEYTWATLAEIHRLPVEEYSAKAIEEYKKKAEEKKN
jgi:nucleoside triphosphatase